MMVEAASWDDWSTSETRVTGEDDKWHVALAPGEVKVVTLEQLDDLFRLSIVDADTKVWQSGMSEWQPLRIIAGLEDAPAPVVPPSRKSNYVKPPAPRPASRAQSPVSVASDSFYPVAVLGKPALAPAQLYPGASVRPLVVSAPPARAQSGPGFGRAILGLAVVAGLVVTLYRNGVLRDGAHAAHRDALYARLEASLGGPAFGTLRGLEQLSPSESESAARSSDALALRHPAAPLDGPALVLRGLEPSMKSASAPTGGSGQQPPVVSLESLRSETEIAAKPELGTPASASVPERKLPSIAPLPAKVRALSTPTAKVRTKVPVTTAAAAASTKQADGMNERERLNAAIGQTISGSHASSRTAKVPPSSNDYDPLNPKL